MIDHAGPAVNGAQLNEVLRSAGVALQDRVVALFEATEDGHVVALAASPPTPLPQATVAELSAQLDQWHVPFDAGSRWLACRLGVGSWCVAPVRRPPAVPLPGAERRASVRITLELAARYLGLLEADEELRHGALHDRLTNLPNRSLFYERVRQALQRRAREPDYTFAVMFLDCDRFKAVNDSLGHVAGDELLVALARRLEATTRPGDMTARLAGDEFTLFLEDVDGVQDAAEVARRVEEQLEAPFEISGQELYLTASIGIALSGEEATCAEDMVRDADIAMYRAKANGRARSEIFDPAMRDRAHRRLSLAMDLRRAVERQEFRVYYQPILDLRTGRLEGFEALVRWQHPERGLIQPLDFIPAAEETGLIVPLGAWVLSEACRQARAWQRAHPRPDPIRISVNCSARQVSDGTLLDQVATALLESGLEPRSLRLEITENALLEGGDETGALLQHLRSLEVQIQLDDFGTGYSSLGYLRRFPLDGLKVDRSFVRRLGIRRHDTELVRTIVALAQNLGLGVVAEGVETVAQRDRLIELGCTLGQGFHFSQPLTPQDIEARIWA